MNSLMPCWPNVPTYGYLWGTNLAFLMRAMNRIIPQGGFDILLLAISLIVFIGKSNEQPHANCLSNSHIVMANATKDSWTQPLDGAEWAMVKKSGTKFVVNGKPFLVSGFNTYWLMVFSADGATRPKVSEVFHQASSVGLNVCRTWAFNDGQWRALQTSPGVYDEDVFKGLDFVVSEAQRFGIRLILSLCNNWEEYGGKAQYVKWGKEGGLNLTSDDEFYTDPTVKGYYKAYVQAVLTRVNTFNNVMYKDDPTILAWELLNEARCSSDPSGDTLQAWIEEMAAHVKSIDPNHLLEIGVEGFYGPSSPQRLHLNPNTMSEQLGTDFIRNHQASGIDFASVHIYSDSWLSDSISGAHLQFVKSWMEDHMDDAEKVLKMPVVFAEFGVSSKDERFGSRFQEAFMDAVYNTLMKSRRRGGSGGGCLLWQLFPEGTEYMDDGYAVFLTKSPSASRILSAHCSKLQTYKGNPCWEFIRNWKKREEDGHEEL